MDEIKSNKVSNMYGRARRIAFAKKVIYILVGLLVITLVLLFVFRKKEDVDLNVNFYYLREYMENKGFRCSTIHRTGGTCVKTNDNNKYTFIRYDDGFEYLANTKGYFLTVKHKASMKDSSITFRTTPYALAGYKNLSYTCQFEGNVLNVTDCINDEDGSVLDSEAYLGVIKQVSLELNNIIDSSGYDKNVLLNDYKWQKNK